MIVMSTTEMIMAPIEKDLEVGPLEGIKVWVGVGAGVSVMGMLTSGLPFILKTKNAIA